MPIIFCCVVDHKGYNSNTKHEYRQISITQVWNPKTLLVRLHRLIEAGYIFVMSSARLACP